MDKFNDVYLEFNQNDSNIDEINLNAVWVDLDKGIFFFLKDFHLKKAILFYF